MVLARIEIEHAHHGGKENGRLPVTYDDFVRYGIHRHAIAPAIRELAALGFIEITQRGRAGNAEFRSPSMYRLTYRNAKDERGDGTHEWQRIETIEQAEAIAKIARRDSDQTTQKQKSSGGKRNVLVSKTTTKFGARPVPETATTVSVRKAPLLSISREGRRRLRSRLLETARERRRPVGINPSLHMRQETKAVALKE
jgi:hypothetical protein